MVEREPATYPCHNCRCDSEGRSPFGDRWKIEGVIDSDRCLRKLVTPGSRFYLDLYAHYRNGVLPVAGGLLDQPYTYFRAMSVLSRWMGSNG